MAGATDELHMRDALRLQNRAIRLSSEGDPMDVMPMPGDPEARPVNRVTAVSQLLAEASDHIDAIRVKGDAAREAKGDQS